MRFKCKWGVETVKAEDSIKSKEKFSSLCNLWFINCTLVCLFWRIYFYLPCKIKVLFRDLTPKAGRIGRGGKTNYSTRLLILVYILKNPFNEMSFKSIIRFFFNFLFSGKNYKSRCFKTGLWSLLLSYSQRFNP